MFFVALLVQIEQAHVEGVQHAVDVVVMQHAPGAVQTVGFCLRHQTQKLRAVGGRHELLDVLQLLLKIGRVSRLVELLVEADDTDVLALPRIKCRGSEYIVEHIVAVDAVVQNLAQVELAVRLEGDAREIGIVGVGNQLFVVSHRGRTVVVVALDITAAEVL